jgi:hypothetical protein
MTARRLGPDDEPQTSGAIVAVHYGDYRQQEIWVASGANIGNWYPLGGEFGRPKPWEDPRTYAEKMFDRGPVPQMPPGHVPLHPHWEDVIARGPVVLLTAADDEAYRNGWRNGRKHMWDGLENAVYDEPATVSD